MLLICKQKPEQRLVKRRLSSEPAEKLPTLQLAKMSRTFMPQEAIDNRGGVKHQLREVLKTANLEEGLASNKELLALAKEVISNILTKKGVRAFGEGNLATLNFAATLANAIEIFTTKRYVGGMRERTDRHVNNGGPDRMQKVNMPLYMIARLALRKLPNNPTAQKLIDMLPEAVGFNRKPVYKFDFFSNYLKEEINQTDGPSNDPDSPGPNGGKSDSSKANGQSSEAAKADTQAAPADDSWLSSGSWETPSLRAQITQHEDRISNMKAQIDKLKSVFLGRLRNRKRIRTINNMLAREEQALRLTKVNLEKVKRKAQEQKVDAKAEELLNKASSLGKIQAARNKALNAHNQITQQLREYNRELQRLEGSQNLTMMAQRRISRLQNQTNKAQKRQKLYQTQLTVCDRAISIKQERAAIPTAVKEPIKPRVPQVMVKPAATPVRAAQAPAQQKAPIKTEAQRKKEQLQVQSERLLEQLNYKANPILARAKLEKGMLKVQVRIANNTKMRRRKDADKEALKAQLEKDRALVKVAKRALDTIDSTPKVDTNVTSLETARDNQQLPESALRKQQSRLQQTEEPRPVTVLQPTRPVANNAQRPPSRLQRKPASRPSSRPAASLRQSRQATQNQSTPNTTQTNIRGRVLSNLRRRFALAS